MFAGDDVNEVKSKIDITDVIKDYVTLHRKGRAYWGLCPFHNEKTPSFCVSQERQTYHCFGCGKGGDVFTFLMEIERLNFKEALEKLAEKAGVRLHSLAAERNTRGARRTYGDINLQALDFFIKSLEGSAGEAGRAYLARRGIAPGVSKRFELGWAPSSWDSLLNYLIKCGFSKNQIVESGLVSQGESGLYDRFRGRVMFPIYSITDKLIGFGGRIIGGDGAKYLNSPESALFSKRDNLYLLNKAKVSIRDKGCAILVEGYMDAIRAHMFGFTNTIASLGTALTESQAALIKRTAGLCYICYDSDEAGQEAALRGMYVLQRHGVAVKVVRLTSGKDPDEILLQENGPDIFTEELGKALPLPVYHTVLRSKDMDVPERSVSARNDLLDGLASLSAFDVLPYLDRIAQQLGMFPHELREEIESRRTKTSAGAQGHFEAGLREGRDDNNVTPRYADDIECMFCSLLWESPMARESFSIEEIISFIKDPEVQNIITALLSGERPEQLEARWRQIGDSRGQTIIARGNGLLAKEGLDFESVHKLAAVMRKRCIENRMSLLRSRMTRGSATEAEQLEYQHLSRILKGGKSLV